MMKFNIKNELFFYFKPILSFLCIFAFSYFALNAIILNGSIYLYVFQERDIARTIDLIKGNLIFFGPEVTGGGHLPGPFYYFLLSIPILLKNPNFNMLQWLFVLMALSAATGWHYLRVKLNLTSAFLWLALFIFSESVQKLITTFMNPSFVFLFVVLINIFIVEAFSTKNSRVQLISFVFACFFTGLSIQLHFSTISYLFSILLLQLLAHRFKINRLSNKVFFLGLFAFILCLSPYFIWLIFQKYGVNLGQEAFYNGNLTDSLPSLTSHITAYKNYDFGNFILLALKKTFLVVPFIFIPLLILFFYNFRNQKTLDLNKENNFTNSYLYFRITLFSLITAFVPFSFYYILPQGSRYGIPFFINLTFSSSILFYQLMHEKIKLRIYTATIVSILVPLTIYLFLYYPENEPKGLNKLILASIFILITIISNFILKNKSILLYLALIFSLFVTAGQSIIQRQFNFDLYYSVYNPDSRLWSIIWNLIYSDTGWSYEAAINRIYFVNHNIEQSPKLGYNITIKNKISNNSLSTSTPDGYFVTISKNDDTEDFKSWLLSQPIHVDIKKALNNNTIRLGQIRQEKNVFVVPYYVSDAIHFPKFFHNNASGYQSLSESNLLENIKPNSAFKKNENEFVFKWNECANQSKFCDTAILVKLLEHKKNSYLYETKIVGLPLSQRSRWIVTGWTMMWKNPYIEFLCDDKTQNIELASSIGYDQQYIQLDFVFKYPLINNSLQAPLVRNISINCNRSPKQISAGRQAAIVDTISNFIELPSQRLTIDLN